jgi:hypothetical protein
MTTQAEKFRPSDHGPRTVMRERRRGGYTSYNFRGRGPTYHVWNNEPFNRQVLGRIAGRLHYLACHAPDAVKKQWRKANELFDNKHFGNGKQSVRYSNTYTCHAWM